ncbi:MULTISPECIES: transglycosylase SLT domain-containing protein [Aminobacterium]|jgi:soluble lytic murein transglycosylase-like protein|uniref:transglycosylase SLT domain-containing protein n=1 Tax=Aminobacterium TaxID=81466 RepID=UPI00046707F5|nr:MULTISPECIES: transglycosylase SLT domain-containing protein [Aminobacterium]
MTLHKTERVFFFSTLLFLLMGITAPPSYAEGQYLSIPSEVFAKEKELKEMEMEQKRAAEMERQRELQAKQEMEAQVRKEAIAEFFQDKNGSLEKDRAEKYAHYVLEAGNQFGVDPFIVASIIIKESRAYHEARSKAAYGLMQINWKVHRNNIGKAFSHIKSLAEMMKPKNNISVGTYIFSCYLNSADGDLAKALASYCGGNNTKYIKNIFSYQQELDARFEKKISKIPDSN